MRDVVSLTPIITGHVFVIRGDDVMKARRLVEWDAAREGIRVRMTDAIPERGGFGFDVTLATVDDVPQGETT